MDKIKLNEFDLFAYVSSGLAAMLCADLVLDTHVVRGIDALDAQAVLLLFAAYVVGHVVSIPASIVMEDMLLGVFLLRPSTLLFRDEQPRLLLRVLRGLRLTEYGDKLDPDVVRRVQARFAAEGRDPVGNARFWAVYPAIHAPAGKDQPASPRVQLFAQLFTFARNLAIVALGFCLATIVAHLFGRNGAEPMGLTWDRKAEIGAVLFAALTLRFLKFYHMNAAEMFIVYSQGPLAPAPEARDDE